MSGLDLKAILLQGRDDKYKLPQLFSRSSWSTNTSKLAPEAGAKGWVIGYMELGSKQHRWLEDGS